MDNKLEYLVEGLDSTSFVIGKHSNSEQCYIMVFDKHSEMVCNFETSELVSIKEHVEYLITLNKE